MWCPFLGPVSNTASDLIYRVLKVEPGIKQLPYEVPIHNFGRRVSAMSPSQRRLSLAFKRIASALGFRPGLGV